MDVCKSCLIWWCSSTIFSLFERLRKTFFAELKQEQESWRIFKDWIFKDSSRFLKTPGTSSSLFKIPDSSSRISRTQGKIWQAHLIDYQSRVSLLLGPPDISKISLVSFEFTQCFHLSSFRTKKWLFGPWGKFLASPRCLILAEFVEFQKQSNFFVSLFIVCFNFQLYFAQTCKRALILSIALTWAKFYSPSVLSMKIAN